MHIPAWPHIKSLFRRQRRLLGRFVVTSLGESVLTMAGILLVKEFLSGVLGGDGGMASRAAEVLGPNVALWIVAGLLLGTPESRGLVPPEWVERAVGGNGVSANFGASVVGEEMFRTAGLAEDEEAPARFRAWAHKLLMGHLEGIKLDAAYEYMAAADAWEVSHAP